MAAVCAGLLMGLAAGNRAAAETLEQALVQAYLNNPTLQAGRASLRATDERVPQALSGWRPTVTMSGSAGYDITDNRARATVGTRRTEATHPTNFDLEVRQPVFRGLRTVSATREAENQVLADRARLKDTEQSVLFQAVTAFMDVVRDQAVLELTINNERVLERQLEAARDRFEVGEITRTDVSQAESRLSRATAQRIAAEGDLTSSRATYEKVIGVMPGRLMKPEVRLALPAKLQESVELASAENPNVVSAQYTAAAASERIKVVRGELLPEFEVVGKVERTKETGTPQQMSESASVTAELTVPIYQSGSVQSRVREAKQVFGQRQVELEEARRQAIEDAVQAWENLETARAQIRAFQSEVRATGIALEGVQEEATVGARTVLDVLDAEQEFLDAQVNLVRAERDEIVAQYQLTAAIGRLTAEDLGLAVEYYDETQHYRRVRGKWFGLGAGEIDPGGPTAGAAPQ
ncbi:MAG: TolC family outer membrane protein [Kiloniellales bacterium]